MARIRTIKPEFWSDEKIGRLPLPCRLLYIGLWNYADDYGVVAASPLLIKSWVFPYDRDITDKKVEQWLDLLQEMGMTIPCDYNGNHYLLLLNFSRHQAISKKSQLRNIPEALLLSLMEDSVTPPGALQEDALLEQGTGIKEQGKIHKEQGNRERFREEVMSFSGKYPLDLLEKFILYWTTEDKSTGELRFQGRADWKTSERLEYWANHERKVEKGISALEAISGGQHNG